MCCLLPCCRWLVVVIESSGGNETRRMRIRIVIITNIIELCVFFKVGSIVLNLFQALVIVGLRRRQAGAIIGDDAVDRWAPASVQVEYKILEINFLWLLNVLLIICMRGCCFYVGDVLVVLLL